MSQSRSRSPGLSHRVPHFEAFLQRSYQENRGRTAHRHGPSSGSKAISSNNCQRSTDTEFLFEKFPKDTECPQQAAKTSHFGPAGKSGKGAKREVGGKSSFEEFVGPDPTAEVLNKVCDRLERLDLTMQNLSYHNKLHDRYGQQFGANMQFQRAAADPQKLERMLKSLPEALYRDLLQEQRNLETYWQRYYRATDKVEKIQMAGHGKGPKHPMASRMEELSIQVATEELRDVSRFNAKLEFETLTRTLASNVQEFHKKWADHQIHLYGKLLDMKAFGERVEQILQTFFDTAGCYDYQDRFAISEVTLFWAKSAHQRLLVKQKYKHKKSKDKKQKLQAKQAKDETRLNSASGEGMQLAGILELRDILQPDQADNPKHTVVGGKQKAINVPASGALGILAKRNPDVAKQYNIHVVDSTLRSANSRTKASNRSYRSKTPSQSSRGARSPSGKSPSRASSSSLKSSYGRVRTPSKSRSSSAKFSSKSSSKGSSSKRSSSAPSSRRSSRFSSARSRNSSKSSSKSGRSSLRRKGSGKGNRKVRFPSQARSRSSSARSFRRTPAVSPRSRSKNV